MRIQDLELPFETVARAPKVRLIGVSPTFAYENGQKTARTDGFRYAVVAEEAGFEKFSVKVEDLTPAITPEALKAATGPVYVTFGGFVGKFYFSKKSGNYEFTANAEIAKVEIMTKN